MRKVFCVGCFIVDGHKFLLGKRSHLKYWYPGVWDVFGGHSLSLESGVDTLNRELREELAIIPTTFELFASVDIFDERERETMHYYIYFVTSWLGNPINCSDEHSEIRWLSREELNNIPLASEKYLELVDAWTRAKKI